VEQTVGSVRNAVGGTQGEAGKLASKWTLRTGVAMESKTSWEVHTNLRVLCGIGAVTHSEEDGAHERMNPSSQGRGGRQYGMPRQVGWKQPVLAVVG
jgi:hypothetical protein